MLTQSTFAPMPPADPAFRPARAPHPHAPTAEVASIPCSELPTRIDTASQTVDARRADAEPVGCLPPGTRLREFVIERVLGEGGFGVVYSAYDLALGRRVAIKEYMPAAFAVRRPDHSVQVRSSSEKQAAFAIGLKSFVNEARLLGQFDHPAVAKVFQFWHEHGTAYFVMPYYTSPTLGCWLRERRAAPIDETWLRHYFLTALDALAFLHGKTCLHRDLSPQNMLVVNDADPLLLDFGAARRVVGEHTASLTAILKPGYAPLEQYDGNTLKQGPWTDLYALAAVMYQAMVGAPPPAAVARVMQASGRSNATAGGSTIQFRLAQTQYSRPLVAAVELALALHPRHRPQSADELASLIRTPSPATVIAPPCVTRPATLAPSTTRPATLARVRFPALNVPLTGSAGHVPSKHAPIAPLVQNTRAAGALIAVAAGLVAIGAMGLSAWPRSPAVAAAAFDGPNTGRAAADHPALDGNAKPIGIALNEPIGGRREGDPASAAIEPTAPAGAPSLLAAAPVGSLSAPAVSEAPVTQPMSPAITPLKGKAADAKPKAEPRRMPESTVTGGTGAQRTPATAPALPPLLTAYSPAAETAPRAQPAAVDTAVNPPATQPAPDVLRALDRPTPLYPAEALRDGIRQGRVQASFVVNPDGSVSGVRIANAAPARVFDRAVRTALAQWRFAPVAAATPATVEFAFEVSR